MATTPKNRQNLLFLRRYAPQTFCAHFSHASNDSHSNLPHTRNFSLWYLPLLWQLPPQKNCQNLLFLRHYAFQFGGICRCYGNHTNKIVKICRFCAVMPFQAFCAHFSHASTDSHLNLPHNRNSSLGASALLWQLHPQKLSKFAVFAPLCFSNCFVHTFHMPQTIHI